MSNVFRFSSLLCVAIILGASAFLVWVSAERLRQVEYLTNLGGWGERAAHPGDGGNGLIVPEHHTDSYHWILQTQQMFDRREWRVRHIEYENAPFGHQVTTASPYRWWLGLLAWVDHRVSGRSLDRAVEQAALFADPLLQLLAVVGAAMFVAWRFGLLPAMLAAVGLVAMFPFTAGFLGGAPDAQGLVRLVSLGSILLLVAGWGAGRTALRSGLVADGACGTRWFVAAGLIGGVGLWLSPSTQIPIVVGCALGGLAAAWVARASPAGEQSELPGPAAWRAWAMAGALGTLLGYLIEYFPAHVGPWQLRAVHPVYGLAWLGLGELLGAAVNLVQEKRRPKGVLAIGRLLLALVAVAAVPVAMWKLQSRGFLTTELSAFRLTILGDDRAAGNLWTWLVQNAVPSRLWATLLPVLLMVPAGWVLVSRRFSIAWRARVAMAFGPFAVAFAFSCKQLSWWGIVDVTLIVLLVAAAAACRGLSRKLQWLIWAPAVVPFALAGLSQVMPPRTAAESKALGNTEIYGLIERDLATWLRNRVGSGRAIALAPHDETTTLYFYGRIGGLATLSWENKDGLFAAVRITSASTIEEAQELMGRRGVTHIIIPSWDVSLDEYARTGMGKIENTFMERLNFWKLPPWLRPVPYQMPGIPGFESQRVTVYEIVEDQEESVTAARVSEYFLEMGQRDRADAARQTLRRFPADVGALTARAQIEIALGDSAAFGRTVDLLMRRVKAGADRSLLWDRRVSLAVVLARAKQPELAREQVKRCVSEASEANLRFLTTGSLYQLLVLQRAYALPFPDPRLHELALTLLPPDRRQRLAP